MSPRPLPRQFAGQEQRQAGPLRNAFDQVFLTALITLVFSFIAAIPMRLIAGSWTPWTFLVGGACTGAMYLQTWVVRRRRRDQALRWLAAGWVDVAPRPWPWDVIAAQVNGFAQVRLARTRVVNGFLVTVADAFWMGGAMGTSAGTFAGSGTVVVVKLPLALPVPIDDPALRAAQAEGRVPPWTVVGDELYAIVSERPFKGYSATARTTPPVARPMPLDQAEAQVARVLTIVAMLRMAPS